MSTFQNGKVQWAKFFIAEWRKKSSKKLSCVHELKEEYTVKSLLPDSCGRHNICGWNHIFSGNGTVTIGKKNSGKSLECSRADNWEVSCRAACLRRLIPVWLAGWQALGSHLRTPLEDWPNLVIVMLPSIYMAIFQRLFLQTDINLTLTGRT